MESGARSASVQLLAEVLEEIGKTRIENGKSCPGLTIADTWRYNRDFCEQGARSQKGPQAPPTATLLRAYSKYTLPLEELIKTCNKLRIMPKERTGPVLTTTEAAPSTGAGSSGFGRVLDLVHQPPRPRQHRKSLATTSSTSQAAAADGPPPVQSTALVPVQSVTEALRPSASPGVVVVARLGSRFAHWTWFSPVGRLVLFLLVLPPMGLLLVSPSPGSLGA